MITKTTALTIVVLIAAVIGLVVGTISYSQQRSALIKSAFNQLELFHHLRKTALEDYLKSSASDVRAMSRNETVRTAMREFSQVWRAMGAQVSVLPQLYITNNQYPAGDKEKLHDAGDGSPYSAIHRAHHPWSLKFLEHFGYYDLFLIDPDGHIVYTVEKEVDFATNLKTGPYAATGLAFVFNEAVKHDSGIVMVDFSRYAPSNDDPAAFGGKAVRDESGKLLGVFAVQLPAEPINNLLHFSEGMGKSGETYTVGADFFMRSQSRFSEISTLLRQKVETPAVIEGLKGKSGATIINDYRNIPVLSVFSPVDHKMNARWVLLAEIDKAEVLENLQAKWAVAVGLITFLASFLAIYALLFATPLRNRIVQVACSPKTGPC